MAAVTHLRQQQQPWFEREQIENLLNQRRKDPVLQTLILAIAGDQALQRRLSWESSMIDNSHLPDLLSAPFGCVRRGLFVPEADTEIHERAFEESEVISKTAISDVCGLGRTHYRSLCKLILPWILSEAPKVVESATLNNRKHNDGGEIEEMLLSLPIDVLTNPGVQDTLKRNGTCRAAGRPLAR
jgi:hypothetical protein